MVDKKEIEHLASLAKLDLGEDPERFAGDMQAIIEMVNKLSELSLSMDSYPLDTGFVNAFREDVASPSIDRAKVVQNAPVVEAGCISVPKMLGNREE